MSKESPAAEDPTLIAELVRTIATNCQVVLQQHGICDEGLARAMAQFASVDIIVVLAEHTAKPTRYPRLLECHPMELTSMRRAMYTHGYANALRDKREGAEPADVETALAEARVLRDEADRAYDDFTESMRKISEAMVRRAAEKRSPP